MYLRNFLRAARTNCEFDATHVDTSTSIPPEYDVGPQSLLSSFLSISFPWAARVTPSPSLTSRRMETSSSQALVESLRNTLRGSSGQKGDVRFQGGTEVTRNFLPWSSDAYNYKPLPAVFQEGAPQSLV